MDPWYPLPSHYFGIIIGRKGLGTLTPTVTSEIVNIYFIHLLGIFFLYLKVNQAVLLLFLLWEEWTSGSALAKTRKHTTEGQLGGAILKLRWAQLVMLAGMRAARGRRAATPPPCGASQSRSILPTPSTGVLPSHCCACLFENRSSQWPLGWEVAH